MDDYIELQHISNRIATSTILIIMQLIAAVFLVLTDQVVELTRFMNVAAV
jgi:hypothetical protein